ncbi:MAG TPA: hypothetical protein VI300_00015 [Solirubrobacter sp.]
MRLADGRVFSGGLPAARHRALQLGLLHADTRELVELTPGTRHPDGRLAVDRRRHPEHYRPGGAGGDPAWLRSLLAHADRIVAGTYAGLRLGDGSCEEVFVGVAPRVRAAGDKTAVAGTRWLWVDLDRPERLDALWSFVAERPCQLLIASGGSGGVHAYWRLAAPLPATSTLPSGGVLEPIERAHDRIIHALGTDADGHPDVADPRCRERSRVMRLAGTINHKSGAWAHVLEADLALEPYRIETLVGDLPDPPGARIIRTPPDATQPTGDPYKQITPRDYFRRLAGITVPRSGHVSCPVPTHTDAHPSCTVGREPEQGWCCHSASCGAGGSIYDLASVLDGGPWGPALRGEAFKRARARVLAAFSEPLTSEGDQRAGRP